MLAVIETHPVQYHAPVYRAVQKEFNIPVTAIYGSDFSLNGYRDKEFGASFKWDTDLTSGYESIFLSRASNGGAGSFEDTSPKGLDRALGKLEPKALLILGYSPRFNRRAFYEGLRSGRPILFRGETTDHATHRNPAKHFIRDRGLAWGYQKASRLLYIGARSYQHYKRLNCPEEKLVFSPYCVDTSPFATSEEARERLRSPARAALGFKRDEIVFLFSGKLSERKGPELILQAIKKLPPRIRERSHVLFLGSGAMLGRLQAMAHEEVPQIKATFAGFQNQSKLSQHYHASDLLILPSRAGETWGLVVNEALHHGLPCLVSTAVGCSPDLISDGSTGYIFESGSTESLVASLEKGIGLIDREEVRTSCREVVSRYSVENAASGIAEAYRQVVKN